MNLLENKTTTLVFDQQSRESDKAFAAFKTYLELGTERSLALVANKIGKSTTLMERWSRKSARLRQLGFTVPAAREGGQKGPQALDK